MAGDVAFVICDGGRCGVCDLRWRTTTGGSLQGVVFLEFRRALLSVDFRIFVGLPPATEVWLRYASPQVASLINGVNDRGAVIERRRSRSVFPRSGTSVAGGEHPIDHKPLPCDGIARNHKTSPCKEPPVASRTIAPARNATSRTITPAFYETSRTLNTYCDPLRPPYLPHQTGRVRLPWLVSSVMRMMMFLIVYIRNDSVHIKRI